MSLEALVRNGHNLDLGVFDYAGKYDIPVLQPTPPSERVEWISFNCASTALGRERLGVHFFVDDYIFQRTWNDPRRYLQLLQGFRAAMSPDFSLFTDYPKAVQIYNHFRKHLLGAYWQSAGLTVIPSICWSDHASYEWCFDGEPRGGCVAVSSVGTQKNGAARQLFMDGYNEMMARLRPAKVIFFGDVPVGCGGEIERHEAFYRAVNARRRA